MRSSLLLTLASACSSVPAVRAISLEKCSYRMTNMAHTDGSYRIAIFDCDFDEELYLKSRVDEDLPPIVSTATKEEVAASIAGSEIVSSIPWSNFAGLTVAHEMAIPNSLFSYSHNVKLSCQHGDIAFELYQKPSHDPPADFLYSLPPTRNSINELWRAFGAYNWPESPLPRRMSVGLMVGVGYLAQGDLETCIEHGALIMSADNSPYEACPDCSFVPKWKDQYYGGCSEDECNIWYYSDAAGAAIDPHSAVVVGKADNQCSLETFTNFTSERLPQLYDLLEGSKTQKEQEAAILSYTTIVNNMDYAACNDVFTSFYTTKSANVFMRGVRGCADPSNMEDPCCNEEKLWSDCCLPEDKDILVHGVFNSSNIDAINAACGSNSASVAALLDSEISQVLISASHPEFGCNAAYEKVVPKTNGDQDIYRTLWDDAPVSSCMEEVRWGKTVTGLDTCNANEECWSGSCASDGGSQKRCTQLYGEAISGPLLSCIVSRVDGKVWKFMANALNIDPSKIKKGAIKSIQGTSQWANAVQKFTELVGSPNCVGEEAERGICAIIDISKEDCIALNTHHDWSRLMEWVVDETNELHGGFCKKRDSSWWNPDGGSYIHIHGHTEDVQGECEAIFSEMEGACIDSTMPNGRYQFKPQSECNGESESWLSFADMTVAGYRLVSKKIWIMDESSGYWKESVVEGDQSKCMLQTSCNWDPEGRITSGDQDLCLDPSPLETTTYPRASFEEDGKHMACLQCWGSRCEDFWSSSPPICVVSPHNHDGDCAEQSGGGPNDDPPVTAMLGLEDHDSHYKCRRSDLKTELECLPAEFCPLPSSEDENHPYDEWNWSCSEQSCWDLSKDEQSCHHDEATDISFGWRSEYRAGAGACRVEYDHSDGTRFGDKNQCESHGFMWWEGRAFKPGKFDTAEECTTYCNDGTWPVQKTCSSGSCNEHCAECVEGDSWRFPAGAACILLDVDQNDCFSLSDYEWDWGTKLCYRKKFSGSESDCIDLDQSGSGGDYDDMFSMSMSMSMAIEESFGWVGDSVKTDTPEQLSLVHQYASCPAQSANTCMAYCWAKDYDDYSSCQSQDGLEWDWSTSVCKYPTWRVNTPSSPTCESYVSGLDVDANEYERWERAEQCWSNGCHFEPGHAGHSLPSCTGQSRGCAQQQGNTKWVDGGDESTATAKILLGCRWDQWKSCSDETSCVNAGECEDWFIGEGGKCIVPIEPNEWGHRKGCHEVKHPDGTGYDWADKLGCVARNSEGYVDKDECSSIGGTWHTRAKSKAECEDDRGDVCTHPFDEWRVFGGIETQEKCDTCGYKTTPQTKWRQGIWSNSAVAPLYWVERAFSTKNTWEENSFDENKFHSLIRNSISRYIADAFKSKVYCELGAYNAFIPAIISMCHADGDSEQSVVKYDLTTSKVSCGDLQEQPPLETYEGSISYANAECTHEEDTFTDTTIGKVVPLAGTSGRRLSSSSVCSLHETIVNSNGFIVGQKLGSGLSFTGVDNATVCINPTVPESEICSNYTEFGVSTVDDYGSFSVPLSTTTTVNHKGELCFDGSSSGVTYAPVKLMNAWESVSSGTTQGPTASPTTASPTASTATPTPTPSPSQSPVATSITASPSKSPSSGPSKSPTTAAPSIWTSTLPSSTPSVSSTLAPTKKGTGSVEVSFEVAVTLEGISDINVDSLDSIVELLEKVFSRMVPQGSLIRLLKVGGYAVARRLVRFLAGDDTDGSSGVEVEFEVVMKEECDTSTCDNSDAISSALYDQVTADLKASVDDGELSRVIREEAKLSGVSELQNVTVSSESFKVSAAKVTVQKAGDEPTTEPPTVDDDSGSNMVGCGLVVMASTLFATFVGMP